MGILNQNDSLIFIIDIQEKLLNAVFNKQTLAKNAVIISKAAAILDIPVIITEQYPKGLGNTINEIKQVLAQPELFEKTSFSALDDSNILESLKNFKKRQIVLFGIETHICVSQTANALSEAGYDVNVILDACGSRSEIEHKAGLNRIKSNNCNVITTEIALFEWLKSSRHPNFKEIQNLIK